MLGRRQQSIIGALVLMALVLVGGVLTFAFHGAPQIPVAPTQDVNPTGRYVSTPDVHDATATADVSAHPPVVRTGTPAATATNPTSGDVAPRGTLVYERNGTIYLLVLGGQERVLVPSGRWPKLSPDGARVAFIGQVNGGEAQVLIVDTRTRQLSVVTNQVLNPALPAWSPDGQHLAFRGDVDNTRELFIIDADGGNLRQVTHAATPLDAATQPVWSMDGKTLFFKDQGDGAFYRIPVAGGMTVRVRATMGEQDFLTPSPDGSALAFTERTGNATEYSLFVADAAGQNERQIATLSDVTAPEQLGSLTWAPDGRAILVATGGSFAQEVINLKNGQATPPVAYGAYPSWVAADIQTQ